MLIAKRQEIIVSRKVIIANTQKQGRLLRKDRKGIIASTREIFALRAEQTADCAIRREIIANNQDIFASRRGIVVMRLGIIVNRPQSKI